MRTPIAAPQEIAAEIVAAFQCRVQGSTGIVQHVCTPSTWLHRHASCGMVDECFHQGNLSFGDAELQTLEIQKSSMQMRRLCRRFSLCELDPATMLVGLEVQDIEQDIRVPAAGPYGNLHPYFSSEDLMHHFCIFSHRDHTAQGCFNHSLSTLFANAGAAVGGHDPRVLPTFGSSPTIDDMWRKYYMTHQLMAIRDERSAISCMDDLTRSSATGLMSSQGGPRDRHFHLYNISGCCTCR